MLQPIWKTLSASLLVCAFVGCDSAPTGPVAPPSERKLANNEEMISMLQSAAERGVAGSEMAGVSQFIDKIENQELAKQLKEDLQVLMSATSPSDVKSKAEEMIARLKK